MQRLLCLKASAGSGKTFSLALRYIALLYRGAKPSEILAVTFTNKAANEMRSRIVKYLRELENESDFLTALAEELGVEKEELLKRRWGLLQNFLVSDLHIMTMDSFFNKIARKFSYMLGLEPDFAIQSDDEKLLWRLFLESLPAGRFHELVRLAKVQSNVEEFFQKLYEKDKELPFMHNEVTSGALKRYEALQQKIVPLLDECSKSALNLVQSDYEKFLSSGRVASIIDNQSIQYKGSIFNKCYSKELEKLFFELIEASKDALLEKEEYLKASIFDFYWKYKEQKRWLHQKENYLDFKDVEHLVFELLRQTIKSDFLYFRLDSRIRHILIDEFQDTSITQWKIFEPLIDEIKASDDFRTFFYVGDTKQAIYRFRGGSSELFDAVYESLKSFGMERRSLDTNFRSKKEIVEFVNRLFNLQEKAKNDSGGYVKVLANPCLDERYLKFEWKENLLQAVKELIQKGVKPSSIAILVYKNDTIVEVADLLKEELSLPVVTTASKQIIHQPKARAVIELLKALHYKKKGRLHLANFNSFIGRRFDEWVSIKVDRPAKMIKEILDNFDLWDSSTLKLLEHALAYERLIDFVYHIEEFSDELPNDSFEGINIMTIHKAKGLEFEHVVVVDSVPKESLPLLLFDYQGLDIVDVRVRMPLLERVDKNYQLVVEKELDLIRKDMLNKEYVAYTRAKDSLWILKNSPVEGKRASSLLALDKAGIESGEWGTLQIQKEEQKSEPVEKFQKEFIRFGEQEYDKEKEYEPNDYEAIYLGLAVHALFEMDGNDYALNRYGVYCDYERAKELYERAKEHSSYKKLLEGAMYRELPFVYGGKSGVIDLLIEQEDRIVIIDYKSARPESEGEYIKQVRFYMDAMRAIKKKDVVGYLFYLDECRLKEVK